MKSIKANLRSEMGRFVYNLVLFLLGIYPLFLFLFWIQHIIDIIIFNSEITFSQRLGRSGFLVLISWLEIRLGMFLTMHLITCKFPTRRAASLSILLFWTALTAYGGRSVLSPAIYVLVPMLISLIVFVMFYRLPPVPPEKNP